MTILIVDDNENNLYQLEVLLGGNGYHIVTAVNGAEALAKARQSPPDLIISDILMPVMDGFALCREWMKEANLRQIPFVFYTATYTDDRDRDFALSLGAVRFIVKPEDPEVFLRLIRDTLRQIQNPPATPTAPAAETPAHIAIETPDEEETGFLRQYNETLIRKLEAKMGQLEQANRELERDIAARKETEEALRESQQIIEGIINAIPVRVFWKDRNLTYCGCNALFARDAGFADPKDIIGKDDYQMVWRDQAELYRGDDRRVIDSGCPKFLSEETQTTPEGKTIILLTSKVPLRSPNREICGVLGIYLDITEHKIAEERIRAQAALLDLAQDAISVRDMNGCVQYWNKSCERLTGWTAAEALGQPMFELTKAKAADVAQANRMLMADGHWNGELGLVRKDGRPFTVMSRWTLVRDQRGESKSILVINTDITEQKKLEAQYLRAQRLEGIGVLASGIAHDLNNILAPVLMIAPLMRETVQDADGRAMLASLESSAQRGADIIKQLLTFARGKPGARVPLPVRHFLNDMNKIIQETFPRDIRSCVDAPNDLWPVLGDATQLHQVLMNLCVNARDAMPDGGTLTLAAKNVTVDEAFTSVTPEAQPGAYVCVGVTDTGTGIAPENLEHIFDPFFTTKEIGKGTGLGLATVLGIVRGHEGFVRVDSGLGRGTTFELYFPASPEAQTRNLTGRGAPPPRGQGELILVVEDEAAVRDFVRRTLENQGYRVVVAAEGAEGLKVFSQHATEIRAVLTDMMMPVMQGPAMIAALRHREPRLIILGMTGLGERTGVKGMESLDLPAMLTKPFSTGELLRALHAALQPSRENAPRKANE